MEKPKPSLFVMWKRGWRGLLFCFLIAFWFYLSIKLAAGLPPVLELFAVALWIVATPLLADALGESMYPRDRDI